MVADPDQALTALVEERGQWLVRCAYLLTHDRELALDLTQDTLVQAWRAWEKVSAAEHPDRYLLRVMLNLHRSHYRRRRLPVVPLDGLELPAPDAVGRVDEYDAISTALGRLTERQRAVIVLRYWADYDDQVIAEVVGCRRTTVRSLAARGLAVLRTHLEEKP